MLRDLWFSVLLTHCGLRYFHGYDDHDMSDVGMCVWYVPRQKDASLRLGVLQDIEEGP